MDSQSATGQSLLLEMIGATVGSMINPDRIVLENVNWSVGPGNYWVITGLHGSGKSDLMATLAGLLPLIAGEYRLFGESFGPALDLERSAARHRLGIVFGGGRLIHDLTLAENIALPLRYHENLGIEEAAERIQRLLRLMGLDSLAAALPGGIGRNWQQRAGLARALALKPELLLLDNPLTALDPRDARWWLEFLHELSMGHDVLDGRALTLIVAADDLRPWLEQARQFAILKERRLIVLGNREQLAQHRETLLRELLPAFSRQV